MTKVYSTALFGTGDKYAQYLPAFVLGALNLFPQNEGWSVHIHVDDDLIDTKIGSMLACLFGAGVIELRIRKPAPLTKAMLWRMAPVFEEPNAEFVFCRDLDAPPMPRDRAVCEGFMRSPASIGTCHDNVAHAGVMGGLCHFRAAAFREQSGLHTLDDLYAYAAQTNEQWREHGTDQNVLNRLVVERPQLVLLEHRFNGWTEGRPGPTSRRSGTYSCKAWSTPTPNVGRPPGTVADHLGNHLGCAGYDHLAARDYWEMFGDSEIARIVNSCERL